MDQQRQLRPCPSNCVYKQLSVKLKFWKSASLNINDTFEMRDNYEISSNQNNVLTCYA